MSALNETENWGELPGFVREAFTRQTAEKVLLPQGMILCKLSDFTSLARPGSQEVSPWWSPYCPYQHDGGWEARKKLAVHLGVSIMELSRIFVAVKENWNAMSYLLVVKLQTPVYAFFGGVAGQDRVDSGARSLRTQAEKSSGSKRLVGNATQFYIPNLTVDHVNLTTTEVLGR